MVKRKETLKVMQNDLAGLTAGIAKLRKMIFAKDFEKRVPNIQDRVLMIQQLGAMEKYHETLFLRYNNLGKGVK